jgi:hypothetical protein
MGLDGLPPSVCGFSVQVAVITVPQVFYFVYSRVWHRTRPITSGPDWMFFLPPESSPLNPFNAWLRIQGLSIPHNGARFIRELDPNRWFKR